MIFYDICSHLSEFVTWNLFLIFERGQNNCKLGVVTRKLVSFFAGQLQIHFSLPFFVSTLNNFEIISDFLLSIHHLFLRSIFPSYCSIRMTVSVISDNLVLILYSNIEKLLRVISWLLRLLKLTDRAVGNLYWRAVGLPVENAYSSQPGNSRTSECYEIGWNWLRCCTKLHFWKHFTFFCFIQHWNNRKSTGSCVF